jgi:hypothetical protein
MSNLQEWLLRWIVGYALAAMPYTARLFAVIREEASKRFYEDNAYNIESYLQEALSYSSPPPISGVDVPPGAQR